MTRGITKQYCILVLASFVLCGSPSFAQSTPQIPAHPDQIKYVALDYDPPEASAYRQVLSNGVVGYFAEDHDLPLTNISVIIVSLTGITRIPLVSDSMSSCCPIVSRNPYIWCLTTSRPSHRYQKF